MMRYATPIALAVAVAACVAVPFPASAASPCCCVCGKKVCVLEVSEGEEEVTRFEVKSKEICIPGIRLPWDKCGARRCGGVRTVCVLEEVKQEKKVCNYDWSIKTICTSCCKRHGIKHAQHHAQVQRDDRVPFEYYTAELAAEADGLVEAVAAESEKQLVVQLPQHMQAGFNTPGLNREEVAASELLGVRTTSSVK